MHADKRRTASGIVVLALAVASRGCGSPFQTAAPPDSGVSVEAGSTGAGGADGGEGPPDLPRFSFFYTSVDAITRLSGSPAGFGGDLRFGMPTGLEGADKICQTIADGVGFGGKTWRAFLSATQGADGQMVNAIDRIGSGPWYDRKARLIAADRAGLLAERPLGDPAAVNDLPDENGDPTSPLGSTYDAVTGSNMNGTLYYPGDPRSTCMDWTNATLENVLVVCGHAWLANGIGHWIAAHPTRSCIPGVNLSSNGSNDGSSIGAGGGWGGFYCFALTP